MKKTILFFCLTMAAAIAIGQQDTSVNIETIVVEANRLDQDLRQSGRSITVIPGKEILRSGARSIDEALQLLAGVEVQTRGVYGTQGDISMRGSTFNQVKVLIDGQPINDPLTGHFNSNIPINMIDVEQIEVLRGPSAAIYGSDAVGGVINIVSRSVDQANPGLRLAAKYDFGGYDLRNFGIDGEVGFSDWRMGVSYSSARADGPDHEMDTLSRYFDNSTINGFIKYSKGAFRAHARVAHDDRDFDARYYYTRSTFDRSTERVKRLWLQFGSEYEISESHTLHLNYSRMDTDDEFLFNPAFSANEHNTISNDARLEWKSTWNKKLKSNIGATGTFREITSNDRGDHEQSFLGLIALAEYKPDAEWTLTPAVRLDYSEIYDVEVNPQLAIKYQKGNWILRGFTGRSIRAADFTELYVNFGRTDTLAPGRNLGNGTLQPEKAWSYEVGADYRPIRDLKISTTAFLRNSEDLIDYVETPGDEIPETRLIDPGAKYFYTQNIGELQTIGVEAQVAYRQKINDKWSWRGRLNYTWIETTGSEGEVTKYLSNHASHLMSWNLGLHRKNIGLELYGLYKQRNQDVAEAIDAELQPDYHVLHTRLTVGILGQLLTFHTQVHNILDTEYSDILGAELPGRWWSFGVRFNWK